jgi:hypothetical protein
LNFVWISSQKSTWRNRRWVLGLVGTTGAANDSTYAR